MRLFEDPAATSKIPALERPAFARVAAAAHPGDTLTVSELFGVPVVLRKFSGGYA
ncbi:hypothetical protein ABT061_40535 [Streptosporangium sp. NPDC002544]|uniref:hypothetical protein n=1 Tax=Streptosporangium sp. NPDC002544 TaxID=3154538 RepID=UPI0033344FED